jgi:DNA-binding SARP family transcriptional activator
MLTPVRQRTVSGTSAPQKASIGGDTLALMLRVRVLGDLALDMDGEPIEPPAGRRARELLAWLALHPGAHPRSELAARFWPDVLDSSARASLRTALHELRRALGERAPQLLLATRERVGVEDGVWVDALEVGRLASEGRSAEALELCRGELLAGVEEDWAYALRDQHHELVAELQERLATAAEHAGDAAAAIARTREQVRLDPLSEEATRRLMRRLARSGDRSAALTAYERLETSMRRELGAAPSRETRELAQRLRVAAEAAPPRAASPRLPGVLRRHERSGLVGRGSELGRLGELANAAARGDRGAVLLAGEPGIGKTRLLSELCRAAHTRGATVLFGRCYEDALTPYQPFAEALSDYVQAGGSLPEPPLRAELGRLVPALAPVAATGTPSGDPEGARWRLFEAVRALLVSAAEARAPVLLALDDLHWADRATLLLLAHLVRSPEPARLLLAGAYRESELSRAHPLSAVLADLRREDRLARVSLVGLGAREVSELVASWIGPEAPPGLSESLARETGGNPFFVEEVLRHLRESGALDRRAGRWVPARGVAELGIPESIREVLGRRLSRLGEQSDRVLVVAAVVGREFDLDLLERVADLDGIDVLSALEEGVDAQLVREEPGSPGRYGFAHPLVRETLYEELSTTRRVRLHAAVADALERAYAGEPEAHLAEIAVHRLAGSARDVRRAVDVALRAARQCLAQLAYDEAAATCRHALDAVDDGDPTLACELRLTLGDALTRAGQAEAARAVNVAAADDARTAARPDLLARAALGRSGLGIAIIAVDDEAVALLREALATLPPGGEDELRSRLVARLAAETYYVSTPEERRRLGDEAVGLAVRSGDRRAQVDALGARRVAIWSAAYLPERLRADTEMLEAARAAELPEAELQARNWLVADLMEAGDLDAARREIAAHEQLADRLRLPAYQWWGPMWRSTLALLEGRFDDAAELVEEFAAIGRRAHDRNAELYQEIQATLIPWLSGRLERAPTELIVRELERPAGYAYRSGGSWVYAALGQEREARQLLDWVAGDDFKRLRDDMNTLAALAEMAQAATLIGASDHAPGLYARLLPYVDRNICNGRGGGGYGSAAHHLGLLAMLVDRPGEAAGHLETALARNEAMGARPWAARTRIAYGRLLAREGELRRGAALAAAGEDEARRLGLVKLAEWAV